MKALSRSLRPWSRLRSFLSRGGERLGRAARLAGAAGAAPDAMMEQLESRQLMFALTITQNMVDPTTGVGTATAFFGYTIPYLQTSLTQPAPTQPTIRLEEFTDETRGAVVSGRTLLESFIRVTHTIFPTNAIRIQGPTPEPETNEMFVQMNTGQTLTFRTVESAQSNIFLPMQAFSVEFRAGSPGGLGIDPAKFQVILFSNGVNVGDFTGQALQDKNQGGPGAGGIGTFLFTSNNVNFPTFDEVRFIAIGTSIEAFVMDDLQTVLPAIQDGPLVESRIFGAMLTFTGPAGATVEVFDLYNRPMVQTIQVGTPPSGTVTLVDPDDDGRPNFNDGIGRIVMTGVNGVSGLTIVGGRISSSVQPTAEFIEGAFAFTLIDNFAGLFDDFETAGYGFRIDPQTNRVSGLPPGTGSVLIGSPYFRDNTTAGTYNPYGEPQTGILFNFNNGHPTTPNLPYGIFADSNMGSLYIHGALMGTSQFKGYVQSMYVGYLLGSVVVEGDLGSLTVGSDAGYWEVDTSFPLLTGTFRSDATLGQLIVGRTLGEFTVSGRNNMSVTVQGDLANPLLHPARDVLNYFEREHPYEILRTTPNAQLVTLRALILDNDWLSNAAVNAGSLFRKGGQNAIIGGTFMRNDRLLSAEWVGSIGTAVQIHGNLGGGDPVHTADDFIDVFSFAADGSGEVVMEVSAGILQLFGGFASAINARVVDVHGRVIAAARRDDRATILGLPATALNVGVLSIRFTPDTPGDYYLVLIPSDNLPAGELINMDYVVTINGMASTTAGLFRSAASLGSDFGDEVATITLLSGSAGSIRSGTALVTGANNEEDPIFVYNDEPTDNDTDQRLEIKSVTVTVPGRLYSITAGGDIEGLTTFLIGGDFGTLTTGLSPVVGEVGPREGDVGALTMLVGGRIALLDIRGAINVDQDDPDDPDDTIISFLPVVITTGTAGGSGDIGMIRVGEHVRAGFLQITTSPGSTIGAFLISQDALEETGTFTGIYGQVQGTPLGKAIKITTGFGSDVRFMDFPRIDQLQSPNDVILLIGGQQVTRVDDGGGTVVIEIVGVPAGVIAGFIRLVAIDGSQGVAIAQIDADLTGGRALRITSLAPTAQDDVISIGRINITGADAGSSIRILGPGHVDIWQINQLGGETMGEIINETPLGDIVAIDVAGLTRLVIAGDLGRTQRRGWSPRLIGPFLGLAQGEQAEVRGELGITGIMAVQWNGETYRPVSDFDYEPDQAFLSDIGSPMSPYLNGLAVRAGNVTDVFVGGSVGDVLVLGGNLVQLVANNDLVTPQGGFNGILGVVYASGDVLRVSVGDGIAPLTPSSPFGVTGVFAGDDIIVVTGSLTGAPSIMSGVIIASNAVIDDVNGILTVELPTGGDFIDAYIASEQLDGWWIGLVGFDSDVSIVRTGDIQTVSGTNADLFRSRINAINVEEVIFTGGVWDASYLSATENIGTIRADHFRNSTLQGQDREFAPNAIFAGEDLDILGAGPTGEGDISDLLVDLLGDATGSITARNFTRLILNVNNTVTLLAAGVDMRASRISVGSILALNAGRNIRTSTIDASGPIVSITAGDSITSTTITSNGPDARIDSITAANLITGTISAAGPIGTVTVSFGDLRARVLTTTVRGNVGTLSAGRDLDITTDISGNVDALIAGRGIGVTHARRVILIRGNLGNLTAQGAQLYSDVRIGQSLTGTALIGPAANLPTFSTVGTGTITAFGRINAVRILGDFGGRIVSYSGGIFSVTVENGSTLPGSLIAAYDGDVVHVTINAGHLLGDIHADYHIWLVTVNASADGVFGDIGVNPLLNPNVPYDGLRNQLPPGVIANAPIQGPRITAGRNIGRITTSNGSIFEAFIHAGRAIGTITVNGDVRNDPLTAGTGTVIASGTSINLVNVSGAMADTAILAGLKSFGADGRPGGIGVNADTNQLGRIRAIQVGGAGTNVFVTSGFVAGADGVYNTADDAIVPGLSFVLTTLFGGPVTNVSVFSDYPVGQATPGVFLGGTGAPPMDGRIAGGIPAGAPEIAPGVPFIFTTAAGEIGTATFAGPGRAFWDAPNNRIVLISTNANASLALSSNTGSFTNFYVVTNDDASMGAITISANLLGDSGVVIDHNLVSLQVANAAGNPQFVAGGNIRNFVIGNMGAGLISALFARTVTITGNFGTTTLDGELVARFTYLGAMSVGGQHAAAVIVDRDAGSFTVGGAMSRAIFRAGGNLGSFTAGSLSESRVSVRDALGPVVVNGNMFDTSIQAGGDLGEDGNPGGTGFNADRATTGFIASVTIGGSFTESDIVAGGLRGPDGFFGTSDDSVAAGRSSIGAVAIAGTAFGSTLGSEQYRIASTGTLGAVTAGGLPISGEGNLKAGPLDTAPLPIVVNDIQVISDAGLFVARIFFNQAMDSSTIRPALLIQEVRASGNQLIDLAHGLHYTIEYETLTNSALVRFQRSLTDRNLPQGALPGPGVYRFTFEGDILRAAVVDARLDGDASGVVDPNGDDFSDDAIVGDAGDKLTPTIIPAPPHRVDFYAPVDLDLVLDSNRNPDGFADPNRSYTLRGSIGDHPDNHAVNFRFGGDVDVYKVTLRAGQILQLGPIGGSAFNTGVLLANGAGQFQFGDTADSLALAVNAIEPGDFTIGASYLIKTTGTYYIVIGNAPEAFTTATFVPDVSPGPGTVGDYNLTVRVFDDADSGFAGDTDSGDGAGLPTPPLPIAFAGPDQLFGTADDQSFIAIGSFFFTHDRGGDLLPNTIDDIVSGANGLGVSITRINNRITTVIDSAIGAPGHVGVPGDLIEPDVDIYHLNNGVLIAPGTKFRVTIKLAELGADLGSRDQNLLVNWSPEVQFGVFETTNASTVTNGQLVFSPTDFKTSGGTPGTIAALAPFTYGYDANGDFFIDFVAPGALGTAGAPAPASYALYLQGVFNTDYSIEIVEQGTGSFVRPRQNVFLETRGGSVDWLEVGGLTTPIGEFNVSALGFTGALGGQPAQNYILNSLVAKLTAVFDAAGVDVVVSTDPNAFEFQDFSTVFLSSSLDPIRFFNERNYGATERSDPFNTDRNDEAVVFVPSFGLLGFTPSQDDADRFVESLTAGVGRRIGELIGLRQTSDVFSVTGGGDLMASNSPENFGGPFAFQSLPRNLSSRFDLGRSNFDLNRGEGSFFLGQQSSVSLLQMLIRP